MHERNFFRKNPDENLSLDLTVTKLGVPQKGIKIIAKYEVINITGVINLNEAPKSGPLWPDADFKWPS